MGFKYCLRLVNVLVYFSIDNNKLCFCWFIPGLTLLEEPKKAEMKSAVYHLY